MWVIGVGDRVRFNGFRLLKNRKGIWNAVVTVVSRDDSGLKFTVLFRDGDTELCSRDSIDWILYKKRGTK